MNDPSPVILIIGGGVAGMAAARTLDRKNVRILLVEERTTLGGHAADWACMATDTCANCGACLSIEMVDQTLGQDNIKLFLGNRIQSLTRAEKGFTAVLTSGESIRADKIVMATGFSPFDPAGLPSLQPGTPSHVVTTARLNTLIREERLEDLFKENPAPRIAFIQCVGSRNRELENDYCSQVCCKISMRHAHKLLALVPDAGISLFYMDLQIIGKETRVMAKALSGKVDLVQGVPAEILENPETKTLSMILEDPKSRARVKREFDLVVLSVGMEPSEHLDETAGFLDLNPNSWGFFNTKEAGLQKDVYVAGCAAGPKDILGSRQEGFLAGARVLKDLGMTRPKNMRIVITGNGPQAGTAARAAADRGYKVVCFGRAKAQAHDGIDLKDKARILSLGGTAGNFNILYDENGEKKELSCAAIIAAPEPLRQGNRLQKGFSKALDLENFSGMGPDELPDRAAILLDYFGPEFKTEARKALTSALAAGEAGKTVFVIMNNMLVHSPTGQQLYDRARKQGIRFFRYNTPEDLTLTPGEKGFSIQLREATLPGLGLDLGSADLVLPPSIKAAPGFEALAALLNDGTDREGFLQSPNVRHRITQSPRKGIFYCGSCHDEADGRDLETEIKDILSILETDDFTLPLKDSGVTINEKKCAKCLTCYRICPHGAIVLNEKSRPVIVPDACFSCHLCVASCPACAIESQEFSTDGLAGQGKSRKDLKGPVVVLACERSSVLAAAPLDLPDHIRLISLPCACRISPELILKTLINGAERVIVSGCHGENCRSMEGTTAALEGVERVLKFPGISPEKVAWEPVAANETQKFSRIISDI